MGNGLIPSRTYRKEGTLEREQYYLDNKRHRSDGPAYIIYNEEGFVTAEHWFVKGKCHREDGPAFCRYTIVDGVSIPNIQAWYLDGAQSCESGPTQIAYYTSGEVRSRIYQRDGRMHREDGPAQTNYYRDGTIKAVMFYVIGKGLHNSQGPAHIEYDKDGIFRTEYIYKNDEELPEAAFEGMEPGSPEWEFTWTML